MGVTSEAETRLDRMLKETEAVSQYAFLCDFASLCSRSTSSLTVKVQFQYSRTQVQRKGHMKVPGCVLEIENASNADLRESNR